MTPLRELRARLSEARRYMHAEFLAACMFFLIAGGAVIESLLYHWSGGVVGAIAMALLGALVWRKGVARWVLADTADRRDAWIATALRGLLSRAGVPHALGITIRPQGFGMAFLADARVDGSAKSGIIVTDSMLLWDLREPQAQEMLCITAAMRDAVEVDRAVLWLPYARPARLRDRLFCRRKGVLVVFGGPWRLRKIVMGWNPVTATARRQAGAISALLRNR